MKATKIKWGKYEVEKNGNKAVVEFDRYGRYDITDGKYYSSWVFSYNGKDFVCIDKKHAFEMAESRL